mmetsp:Transcript_20521/g.47400  ORF Transcript_20521/g.47400 Transcript_20521/m.47400 type:complete len:271 (+) Transcript_20521:248-1060(+)
MRRSVHVGDHRDAGLLDLDLRERLLQLRNRRLHEIGVEGASHSKRDRHTGLELGLGNFCHLGTRVLAARHGVVARAEVVCDLDLAARQLRGLFAHLVNHIHIQSDDAHHAALLRLRGRLHGLATDLDHLEAVLEGNSSRKAQRSVLTEAQTSSDGRLIDSLVAGVLPEPLHGRQRRNIDSRLAVDSGVELLLGPLNANLQEVVAEHISRLVKQLFGLGYVLRKLPRHSDVLSTLSGEQEGGVGLPVGEIAVGHHTQPRPQHVRPRSFCGT